ncbi:MAG: adenylosuccinate lyase [Aquaticitalea sp.]
MTTEQLYTELNYVDHSRANRNKYAQMVIAQPKLIPKLLDILFRVDDKVSCRAAWVLEFMCSEHLEALLPYLDRFTENIHKVHLDSAERPVAKICESLALAYDHKEKNAIQSSLSPSHKEKIIEAAFDWMIKDVKVAPKAYSMTTLYLLGKDYDWVHPELRIIIERDFSNQSAAFKARARHILKKINKN